MIPSDTAFEQHFHSFEHSSFTFGAGVLSPTNASCSWVMWSVEELEKALQALEAGVPLTTPVPARMGPADSSYFQPGNHSREQPAVHGVAAGAQGVAGGATGGRNHGPLGDRRIRHGPRV